MVCLGLCVVLACAIVYKVLGCGVCELLRDGVCCVICAVLFLYVCLMCACAVLVIY